MTELSVLWTDAVDAEITTADLEAFLRAAGLVDAVWVESGPELPRDPGAGLVVTWLAGAGLSLEHMLDTPAFQVRSIGPQHNPDEARLLAQNVDRALIGVQAEQVGQRYVVEIRRAGGKPAIDRIDEANRTHYVCTYLADVATD